MNPPITQSMKPEEELKQILMKLLHGIRTGDVDTYKELVSKSLSCFEPETQGHNVDGLAFHLFFMEHSKIKDPYHLEIVNPIIRVYGDTGYTAYTLIQNKLKDGNYVITQVNETRIFNKENGKWKMVHFHRS